MDTATNHGRGDAVPARSRRRHKVSVAVASCSLRATHAWRETGNGMLPDFRFVIGALLATIVLGVTSFGLLAAVRLTHQGKIGPLVRSTSEVSRRVA